MTDDDPLAGADVGETVTISEETTHYHLTPDELRGEDRFADVEIEAVHYDPEYDKTHIEWDVEVTKALPPRWDYCREPLTDAARRRERLSQRLHQIWQFSVLGGTGILVTFVAHAIMSQLAGELVINGEPMAAPPDGAFVGVALLVVGLAALIHIVLGDGQARATGGRR